MKSKKDRQKWWADLSQEDREVWFSKKLEEKDQLRKEKGEAESTLGGISSCDTCFHLLTKNCDGLMDTERCCKYWYDPKEIVIGTAYLEQIKI